MNFQLTTLLLFLPIFNANLLINATDILENLLYRSRRGVSLVNSHNLLEEPECPQLKEMCSHLKLNENIYVLECLQTFHTNFDLNESCQVLTFVIVLNQLVKRFFNNTIFLFFSTLFGLKQKILWKTIVYLSYLTKAVLKIV